MIKLINWKIEKWLIITILVIKILSRINYSLNKHNKVRAIKIRNSNKVLLLSLKKLFRLIRAIKIHNKMGRIFLLIQNRMKKIYKVMDRKLIMLIKESN